MKRASTTLLASLLTSLLSVAAALPAAAEGDARGAAYTFAVAKLLADEGSYRQALESFEKAVELAPEDPYVRAEYAELLVRLAQLTRLPGFRQQHLESAAEQAAAAHRLAPEDLEILKVVGSTYLTLAELDPQDPSALTRAQGVFEQIRTLDEVEVQARLALAQIYAYQDSWEVAAELYQEVIDTLPGDRRVYGLLIDALLRSGRSSDAERVLAELLQLDPTAWDPRRRLAELQGERGDHRTAAETLEAGPPEMLEGVEVRRFLAVQLYLSGQLARALEEVDAVLAERPEPPLARLRAVILASLGRSDEAVAQLEALLEQDPEDPELAATLGRVLAQAGRNEEAIEILTRLGAPSAERAEESGENAAEIRLELLELLVATEQWGSAEEVAVPLLTHESPHVRLNAALAYADALFGQGRNEEALAVLSGELEEQPAVVAKRAELLLRLGRMEEADAAVAELTASGEERFLVAAGAVFQQLELYDKAVELIEKHLAAHPDEVSPGLLFVLGSSFERSGRYAPAEDAFRHLLELDPESHQAMNYLGYMWAERGDKLAEAQELIEKAVAMQPDNGAYVDSLGWVYFQLGRFEDALTELERAAVLVPGDATVLEHLGDVYSALGRRAEAKDSYLQALKLEDADEAALRRKLAPLESVPPPDSRAE